MDGGVTKIAGVEPGRQPVRGRDRRIAVARCILLLGQIAKDRLHPRLARSTNTKQAKMTHGFPAWPEHEFRLVFHPRRRHVDHHGDHVLVAVG